MLYQARKFDHLIGMEGFSDSLLRMHLALYEGYVKNTNILADRLAELGRQSQTATPEYAELNRHFGWEFNGMRLHEYYFGNMIKGGSKLDRNSALFHKIESDFGSLDRFVSASGRRSAERVIGKSARTTATVDEKPQPVEALAS